MNLEDCDCQEQPVNYSLKYSDEYAAVSSTSSYSISGKISVKSKIPLPKLNNYVEEGDRSPSVTSVSVKDHVQNHDNLQRVNKYRVNFSKKESVPNRIITVYTNSYAETDLDQLVDYSRKYQERVAKEERNVLDILQPPVHCNSFPNMQRTEGDHSKLSCNYEDTVKVYCTEDTPVNFSSSSSMTDLREICIMDCEPNLPSLDKNCEVSPKNFNNATTVVSSTSAAEPKNTTLTISTFPVESDNKTIAKSEIPKMQVLHHIHHNVFCFIDKSVTFGEEVNFCEETPLMFSRSSSLASLSSFDQPSIHDDRSSVSDFSHLTSGIISPSELPDSPSQTMPPSPVRKKPPPFPTSNKLNGFLNRLEDDNAFSNEDLGTYDVFDDIKTAFAVEGTPIQFSRTTSLSSLSMENDADSMKPSDILQSMLNGEVSEDKIINTSTEIGFTRTLTQESKEDTSSCFSENDEEMLLRCIQLGMPSRKAKGHSKK